MENLEFTLEAAPQIEIKVEQLDSFSLGIHQKAVARGKKYAVAEAELLESIMEVDKYSIFERFGETHLTPYCVKYMKLSEDIAAIFVRVARKSVEVPDLKQAIDDGRLTISKAKVIASVVTKENKTEWIEKAEKLSKHNLEKDIAAKFPSVAKPESAKPVGPDRVRVEIYLTHEEMKLFREAQDLACQKNMQAMSLGETAVEAMKCFVNRESPVRKAERAAARKAKPETKKPNAKKPRHSGRSRRVFEKLPPEPIHAHCRHGEVVESFAAFGLPLVIFA